MVTFSVFHRNTLCIIEETFGEPIKIKLEDIFCIVYIHVFLSAFAGTLLQPSVCVKLSKVAVSQYIHECDFNVFHFTTSFSFGKALLDIWVNRYCLNESTENETELNKMNIRCSLKAQILLYFEDWLQWQSCSHHWFQVHLVWYIWRECKLKRFPQEEICSVRPLWCPRTLGWSTGEEGFGLC